LGVNTVSRLLKKVGLLTANIRRLSSRTPPNITKPFFYTSRKDELGKVFKDRKRSNYLIMFLQANKLYRTFEELFSFEITPRIYRLVIWKYLPIVFRKTHQWLRDKFEAIASKFILDYMEASLSRKQNDRSFYSHVIKHEGLLLQYPRMVPREMAHNLTWTTIVEHVQSQTPL